MVGYDGWIKPTASDVAGRYITVRGTMDIALVPLSATDAMTIYEAYRDDREPDSPQVAFQTLSSPDNQRIVAQLMATHQLIRRNELAVGFISVSIQPDQTLNLGFGLFPALRGQGLMGRLLRQLVPDLQQRYPQHQIVAATRLANHAAMRTLTRAGFRPTTVIIMPPIGNYHDPIPYQQFSYSVPTLRENQEYIP
jgi:RimJ/RimL family protein N-acetyltransferase